uniref:Pinin_SDK_memA domain-containing protein n=1 Tax=Heterorhabditis bacteriophora TaxID=37862 RepID=A0A1I7XIJ6_HETBA
MASERHNLIEQRREQERELRALQRKKALMQYAEAKQEHYKLLMNFIQTQTKPTLFFAPAKHSLRSLELLKNSQKGIQGLMDLRQKELERELAANVGEEPEHEDETAEPMRSFVAESESNRKRRHERSGSKEENGSESDEECRKSPEEEEVNPKEDSPEKEADEVELQEEDE